jgi:hypothetical protein
MLLASTGLEPDVVTYSTLLNGYCKIGGLSQGNPSSESLPLLIADSFQEQMLDSRGDLTLAPPPPKTLRISSSCTKS